MVNFYNVEKRYIEFLKKFDNKVPNIDYNGKHDKFFCGVVLTINDINYFAPISSFSKKQRTNIVIEDVNAKPISSIRFAFMFPAPIEVLSIKDFKKEDSKYQRLLQMELKFCNKNVAKIYKKAKDVYKIGTTNTHPLNNACCNFKLLEEKYKEYNNKDN